MTQVRSGRDASRRRLRHVPGQQFIEPVDRIIADAPEDVAQPGLGFETVELGGADQGVEDGGAIGFVVKHMATKDDIAALRTELKGDIVRIGEQVVPNET